MATLAIDWRRLFNSPGFRKGWIDKRKDVMDRDLADSDPTYALGRCASIEAKGLELPEPASYFSMQMRMVLEVCPEMRREMRISGLRFFASIKNKENVS